MPRPAASVALLQCGLVASAHRDLPSHLRSFDDSLGQRPAGRTWQPFQHQNVSSGETGQMSAAVTNLKPVFRSFCLGRMS